MGQWYGLLEFWYRANGPRGTVAVTVPNQIGVGKNTLSIIIIIITATPLHKIHTIAITETAKYQEKTQLLPEWLSCCRLEHFA